MASISDARGHTLQEFDFIPKRIVSVVPSQTELLYHLGLDAEVIGITKFCIHPDTWFRSKTRVGGTKNLHLDAIKSLQPDLVLANKEENTKEQVEALAEHIPVWVTDVSNLNEALQMIEAIGTLTNKNVEATFLKTHIAQAFEGIAHLQNGTPWRACYLIWKDPYLTVGGGTFIHDMLQHAGFENIFARDKRYPEISISQLNQLECEVLLLSSEPYPFAEKHIQELQQQLPQAKIILVDGEMFSWYGSRLQWAPAYFKKLHEQLQEALP